MTHIFPWFMRMSNHQKHELAKWRSKAEEDFRESRLSMSRYLTVHQSCQEDDMGLADGSILADLHNRGHLATHQIRAWLRWYYVVTTAWGNTNGMHPQYSERVDSSANHIPIEQTLAEIEEEGGGHALIKKHGPCTYLTAAGVEFEQLWGFVNDDQKGILEQLTRDYYRVCGDRSIHAPTLRMLGSYLSGYRDRSQSIAAGVAAIQLTLNSVAQFYGFPKR